MAVVYKAVRGFSGYRVGDDGSVWSCRYGNRFGTYTVPWKLLKASPNKDGHIPYLLYRGDGSTTHKFGHQLVLEAFRGRCPAGMEACHNNGNPADNQLTNLRWGTPKSNAEDCIRHGRRPRGEVHGRAKIEEASIHVIDKLVAQGTSKAAVGRTFGISSTQVRKIVSRAQWKHVTRRMECSSSHEKSTRKSSSETAS